MDVAGQVDHGSEKNGRQCDGQQSPKGFQEPEWILNKHEFSAILVVLLALLIVFSVFTAVEEVDIASGSRSDDSPSARFGNPTLYGAWATLMVVLPLLLIPFAPLGATGIAIVELIMLLLAPCARAKSEARQVD
ncbi:MAG: hypothetical protein ABSB56_02370 [Nitrososphaerales archaeon]